MIVLVEYAKAVGRQWVLEEASPSPGFFGAFYHGSTHWLPDHTPLPATSDIDVIVVLAGSEVPDKLGKFIYRDVMLDVSYLPWAEVQSPEMILPVSHLAGSFRTANIIADPSGQLTVIQAGVAKDYAKRRWVYRRCQHAEGKILNNLEGLRAGVPFHDQVLPWLFATGVTTHVLLVAGLKNPTVRTRYMAAHDLLAAHGRVEFHEALLALLGCAGMRKARVEQHLAALVEVFDAAKVAITSPFPFAGDISDAARPIVIDGSRELIERGYHREAIFWIVVTYSRCQQVLYQDAPVEVREQFDHGYRLLLDDLGISTFADLQRRGEEVRRFLPRLWEVAEAIMAANPAIEDE